VRATKPDVLLLEISMPRTSGIETIRWIRDSGCATRCLVVSAHERAGHVTEALRAGAAGYVVKTAGPDELLTAVEAVRAGRLFLSPSIADWVVTDLIERKEPASILTPREREVLQLIAEGYSSREMAARLGVSAKTVESHRFNIMSKMKVRKSSQLVRVAIQEGLVAP
jgi:DNA-binding NarL/FixJ family response regulator